MCFSLKIVQITEVNLISVRDPQQFAKREDLFANFVQNSYKVGIVSFQYEDDTKFQSHKIISLPGGNEKMWKC